jgi:hypothetical protein
MVLNIIGSCRTRFFDKRRQKKLLVRELTDELLGGSGEIRTHERLTPSPVFKSMKFIVIIKDLQQKNFRNYSKLMLIYTREYHRVGCGCGTVFSAPKPLGPEVPLMASYFPL